MLDKLKKLNSQLKSKIYFNHDIGKMTWFRTGGKAELFISAENENELEIIINSLKGYNYLIIGMGSNILIRDKGYKGAIIKLGKGFNSLRVEEDKIISGASILDNNLSKFAKNNSIKNLEFFSGIPGTVGGAIKMNAGCFGCETKDVLREIFIIDKQGNKNKIKKTNLELNYRTSNINDSDIITSAIFDISYGDPDTIIDNINIDGATIGHTSDNDLMTLADGSVTFTGSTVIATADVNGGAIDAVTLGTNSAVTRAVIDNIEMNNNTIGHTSDTDLLTLASGIATVAGELSATTLDIGGTNISASAAEINYNDITTLGTSEASKAVTVNASGDLIVPDGDKFQFGAGTDMTLYHDGSHSYITNATGDLKVATQASGIAVTIGHTTSETTVGDNLTVTGDAAVTGDLTVTGNDITFGNSETISNGTDGDFLFTTGTQTGALTLKNSNTSDGIASIELVSDNGADVGDGYELKSVNGTFTVTSDHSTGGTYNDTYLTIVGNSNPASSVMTVAGELSATTLDIGGTNISASATELNYTDVTTLGTSEASKAVTVDSNGDLLVPDSDKYKFGAGSDMQLYHDGSDSYITNATGTMKVATESSGIAVTIGHTTSETTVGDNLTVTGDAAVTGDLTVTGNDITFGNGETISNATDGDFLLTTNVTDGAFVLKNSNSTDGNSKIELVSDNADNAGDGYELKSVNGTFTITSDHSSSGTYNDTYITIDGHATPASSTTKIAGDLLVDGGQLGLTGDTDLLTLASGIATVAGELSATTLDIGGTNISASATELNYTDVTTLGTSEASKAVTVDSNGDLLVPDPGSELGDHRDGVGQRLAEPGRLSRQAHVGLGDDHHVRRLGDHHPDFVLGRHQAFDQAQPVLRAGGSGQRDGHRWLERRLSHAAPPGPPGPDRDDRSCASRHRRNRAAPDSAAGPLPWPVRPRRRRPPRTWPGRRRP